MDPPGLVSKHSLSHAWDQSSFHGDGMTISRWHGMSSCSYMSSPMSPPTCFIRKVTNWYSNFHRLIFHWNEMFSLPLCQPTFSYSIDSKGTLHDPIYPSKSSNYQPHKKIFIWWWLYFWRPSTTRWMELAIFSCRQSNAIVTWIASPSASK